MAWNGGLRPSTCAVLPASKSGQALGVPPSVVREGSSSELDIGSPPGPDGQGRPAPTVRAGLGVCLNGLAEWGALFTSLGVGNNFHYYIMTFDTGEYLVKFHLLN